MPHVRFQVPFLGPESQLKSGFACAGLFCRAAEEWERCICENQAFSTLHQAQEGRQELIKKDGGEMLVSIVLNRPLAEAKALVNDLDRLISEISTLLSNQSQWQAHPLLSQIANPDVRDESIHKLDWNSICTLTFLSERACSVAFGSRPYRLKPRGTG